MPVCVPGVLGRCRLASSISPYPAVPVHAAAFLDFPFECSSCRPARDAEEMLMDQGIHYSARFDRCVRLGMEGLDLPHAESFGCTPPAPSPQAAGSQKSWKFNFRVCLGRRVIEGIEISRYSNQN